MAAITYCLNCSCEYPGIAQCGQCGNCGQRYLRWVTFTPEEERQARAIIDTARASYQHPPYWGQWSFLEWRHPRRIPI